MHWRSKRINALEQGLALWRPAATMFMAKALFVDDSQLLQCLEIFEEQSFYPSMDTSPERVRLKINRLRVPDSSLRNLSLEIKDAQTSHHFRSSSVSESCSTAALAEL